MFNKRNFNSYSTEDEPSSEIYKKIKTLEDEFSKIKLDDITIIDDNQSKYFVNEKLLKKCLKYVKRQKID